MFFKKSQLALLLSSVLVVSGCGLNINEAPPQAKHAEFVAGDKVNCIKHKIPILNAFLAGKPEGVNIEEFWDCAISAWSIFLEKSEGVSKDVYTAKALGRFLEKYFLDEVPLSDSLITEAMRFKQLFLGGENDILTRSELEKTIRYFETFKVISKRLQPYMQVYVQSWEPQIGYLSKRDTEYFERANEELQRAILDLTALLPSSSFEYRLDDFVSFLSEFEKILDGNTGLASRVAQFMPLVKKVKGVVAGGKEESLSIQEWKKFLILGSRGYFQYLRFHYYISKIGGASASHQVIYIAKSLDDTFALLADLVSQQDGRVITREELLVILQKLSEVFPKFKVSDALLLEIMKVKRIFFGGSLDVFPVGDFERGRHKVEVFRSAILEIIPYLSVYSGDWDSSLESPQDAKQYFKAAQQALLSATARLGGAIEDSYNLSDLRNFSTEMVKLYGEEAMAPLSKLINSVLPVVIEGKILLAKDGGSTVRGNQWTTLFYWMSSFYNITLQYQHFVKSTDSPEALVEWNKQEKLQNLGEFVRDSVSVLKGLLESRSNRLLSYIELDRLIDALQEGELLKDKLSAGLLKKALRVLLNSLLLPPGDRLTNVSGRGLTLNNLNYILSEFNIWQQTERLLLNVFESRPPMMPKDLLLIYDQIAQGIPPEVQKEGIVELRKILETAHHLPMDDRSRVVIEYPSQARTPYAEQSLSQLNVIRALVRLAMGGYSQNLANIRTYVGLTEVEFTELIKDVVPLLVEIGLLEKYKESYGAARFLEANLFSARADGNEFFGFYEGADYLRMLVSAIGIHGRVEKLLKEFCYPTHDKLPAMIDYNCYRKFYEDRILELYPNMPQLEKYVSHLPTRKAYLTLAEKGAGVQIEKAMVASGDLSLIASVVHYIEMTLVRFDLDANGFLDVNESLKAFPVFKNLLRNMTGFKNEKTLEALFTYMLKYGKPPARNLGGYLRLKRWQGDRGNWSLRADRAQLLQILAEIQAQQNEAGAQSMPVCDGKKISCEE